MDIKLTFFNSVTFTKRVLKLTVRRDYNNHCWDVTVTDEYGRQNEMLIYYSPMELIDKYKKYDTRKNEYFSAKIKEVK